MLLYGRGRRARVTQGTEMQATDLMAAFNETVPPLPPLAVDAPAAAPEVVVLDEDSRHECAELAQIDAKAADEAKGRIAALVARVRAESPDQQAALVKLIGAEYGRCLKDAGIGAHAQRACDLRAILAAAAIEPQWKVPAGGVQAVAKAARAVYKKRSRPAGAGRAAKPAAVAEPAEMSIQDCFLAVIDWLEQADEGKAHDVLFNVARKYGLI